MKHKHGGDIYSTEYVMDYSANINPLGTPASVVRAAQEAVLMSASYPDVEYRKLKKALAQKENVSERYLICGNGAAELIFAAVHAVKPSKSVLIAPGFAEYEQALRADGCEILFYTLKEEEGFGYGDDYLQLLTEDIDMIFLCNPNNPTGVRMDRGWIIRILDKCRQNGTVAVLDSCFIEFLENEEEADLSGELETYPNLFLLKAFTKIYAMAGLRLGYGMCSDEKLLERMRESVQPWSVSIPAQEAGCAALKEFEFVEKTRLLITEERKRMLEEMEKLGFRTYDSRANFIFFQGPEDLDERMKERGILIRSCSNYLGLKKGFFRIAVRTGEENQKLLEAFAAVTEQR